MSFGSRGSRRIEVTADYYRKLDGRAYIFERRPGATCANPGTRTRAPGRRPFWSEFACLTILACGLTRHTGPRHVEHT